MALRGTLLVATLLLSGPLALRADTVYYPNFTSTAGLTIVGDTTTTTTGDGTVLRIVPATEGQSGAAYSTTPITLGTGNSFSTEFQFRFTDTGGIAPADGITFVLSAGSSGLGSSGGGLGYGGVGNSLAIEFDTYQNSWDPNDNHVGVDVNGNLTSLITATPYGETACSSTTSTNFGCMSDGDLWTATITYDGTTDDLNVWVQDGTGAVLNLISNYNIDTLSYLGTNVAYVGFTGGTGSGFENEDIKDWEFSNTSTLPPPPSSTPEPGSLVLLGTGLSGIAALMRRRLHRL